MWVHPDKESVDPNYQQLDINAELDGGALDPIDSGTHDTAMGIRQRGATLLGGRLAADAHVVVPDAAHVHLYVAAARRPGAGRALRCSTGAPARLAAMRRANLVAGTGPHRLGGAAGDDVQHAGPGTRSSSAAPENTARVAGDGTAPP